MKLNCVIPCLAVALLLAACAAYSEGTWHVSFGNCGLLAQLLGTGFHCSNSSQEAACECEEAESGILYAYCVDKEAQPDEQHIWIEIGAMDLAPGWLALFPKGLFEDLGYAIAEYFGRQRASLVWIRVVGSQQQDAERVFPLQFEAPNGNAWSLTVLPDTMTVGENVAFQLLPVGTQAYSGSFSLYVYAEEDSSSSGRGFGCTGTIDFVCEKLDAP